MFTEPISEEIIAKVEQIIPITYSLAICLDCQPIMAMPFVLSRERDKWLSEHVFGTGHRVISKGS